MGKMLRFEYLLKSDKIKFKKKKDWSTRLKVKDTRQLQTELLVFDFQYC